MFLIIVQIITAMDPIKKIKMADFFIMADFLIKIYLLMLIIM